MKWISDIIELIFPRHCLVCGDILAKEEKDICLNCLVHMPIIDELHRNELEKAFWGIIPVERVTSYIYYRKGSPYNNVLHHLKYRNRPDVGLRLAINAANELKNCGFFDGIDMIVPLPLSKKKQRIRGYNQCDYIAKGISLVTDIPIVNDRVKRVKANETQTHKNREERWKNVEGIFEIEKPEIFEGKHLLLIDDVLTTGATLSSCAKALISSAKCRISIFTLAYSYNKM